MKNILLTLTVLLAVMGAGAGLLPATPAQAADMASLPVVAPAISCDVLGHTDLAPAVGAAVHGQKAAC
ncbi:hypothetical protein [Komagataeibacter oboediens]|uniref:hypothetical protein n=1 Tax=Komagataeibacter oboediens TaxID=65958 RepID=UPI0021ABD99E|nr:hypothetical protein [Komagataeibacter oboediens]